jgi:UDP-GlcNAc:undecaprenyl-phosphate GlcNAc-1-phosphate transferase
MLSVINAFNLVDVIDGLAAVLAIVSASTFFIMALVLGDYMLSLMLIIFIGSLCAFLFYNKPPAKIYLGDAGSLFVGGFISAMPLLFSWTKILNKSGSIPVFARGSIIFETGMAALVPVMVVGVPLLEVVSLIIIRKIKGIPFYSGSPDHFAIYLKNKGYSISRILLFSGASAIFLSSLGLLFLFGKVSFLYVVLGILGFLSVWVWRVLM